MTFIDSSKICSKCKIDKPLSEFYKHAAHFDGVNSACRICLSGNEKQYRRTHNGLFNKIVTRQRSRSKLRGHVPPNYSLNEFREWALGIPEFHRLYEQWANNNYASDFAPSADRLEDDKPYTFDNLQWVTWKENREKGHSNIKNGISTSQSKPVIQMAMDGTFIAEYHSMKNAQRETSIFATNIANCCNGKYKTSGGYRWMHSLGIPINNNRAK